MNTFAKGKKKLLWISPYAPYDEVAHAGGKCHNFYIKYFHSTGQYEITLLSLCMDSEKGKLDLEAYGIKNHIFVMDENPVSHFCRLAISGSAYKNPFDRYGAVCLPYERRQMKKLFSAYKKEEIHPEVVILQWTFSLMLIDEIRKSFPEAKIVAIEEDVTFLNYQRRKERAQGRVNKFFWKSRFEIMKKIELEMLEKTDLIVTNNPKDTKLLRDNGIEEKRIFTAAPYFDDYSGIERDPSGKDIIFFGAMSRAENYLSAIWFIRKVMPLLADQEIRFVVIGGDPNLELQAYQSERIVITGFVKDVSEYFSRCMCLAAPLVGGAGIKIKILEAMSAGIPVLTNEIGIEGIGAEDGREYIHCERPEEYARYIENIVSGQIDRVQIAEAARKFIRKNYNLPKKLDELLARVQDAQK